MEKRIERKEERKGEREAVKDATGDRKIPFPGGKRERRKDVYTGREKERKEGRKEGTQERESYGWIERL